MAMETSQICRRFGVIFQEYFAPSESNPWSMFFQVSIYFWGVYPISHGFFAGCVSFNSKMPCLKIPCCSLKYQIHCHLRHCYSGVWSQPDLDTATRLALSERREFPNDPGISDIGRLKLSKIYLKLMGIM